MPGHFSETENGLQSPKLGLKNIPIPSHMVGPQFMLIVPFVWIDVAFLCWTLGPTTTCKKPCFYTFFEKVVLFLK